MKSLHVTLIFLAFFTLPHLSMAQGKRKPTSRPPSGDMKSKRLEQEPKVLIR